MKKNVWKRHAALTLIGTMAIGSLYGCGNKSTTSAPTQATTENSTDGTTSDRKEKLVIALQTYSFITDYDNNYLTKLLEDKLGALPTWRALPPACGKTVGKSAACGTAT